jgi:hypothetical protein
MSTTTPPEYLVISTSLRSGSLSHIMAQTVRDGYAKLNLPNQFVDLREFVLPLCDGGAAYEHPHVATLTALIKSARVIICAAGGGSSYMSVMGLANSLMLDFRCLIIPRFVYAKGDDFASQKPTAALTERLDALVTASTRIRNAA